MLKIEKGRATLTMPSEKRKELLVWRKDNFVIRRLKFIRWAVYSKIKSYFHIKPYVVRNLL
ncbi:hypothetical protein NEICINOT_03276 [Neisseria cinerea ATCC 14685]|uniref:Uncharacterized protein n=1 Tax=Neisseria cinerea ATCC 14685 TaxID=546262 RepID=D0W0V9_NEICI|nr:hypothetical protein NEICINOT_03276 [Neisseria cinerea ATCC 14685]